MRKQHKEMLTVYKEMFIQYKEMLYAQQCTDLTVQRNV